VNVRLRFEERAGRWAKSVDEEPWMNAVAVRGLQLDKESRPALTSAPIVYSRLNADLTY
jgi:hypothetical protein